MDDAPGAPRKLSRAAAEAAGRVVARLSSMSLDTGDGQGGGGVRGPLSLSRAHSLDERLGLFCDEDAAPDDAATSSGLLPRLLSFSSVDNLGALEY